MLGVERGDTPAVILYQLVIRGGDGMGGVTTFHGRRVFASREEALADLPRFRAACEDRAHLRYLDDSIAPKVGVIELDYQEKGR